jgi:hypothetical protein
MNRPGALAASSQTTAWCSIVKTDINKWVLKITILSLQFRTMSDSFGRFLGVWLSGDKYLSCWFRNRNLSNFLVVKKVLKYPITSFAFFVVAHVFEAS